MSVSIFISSCAVSATGDWMTFVSWCTSLHPLGGDSDSEGGQWLPSQLPLASSHRCQRGSAQRWTHPLLFESKDLKCM